MIRARALLSFVYVRTESTCRMKVQKARAYTRYFDSLTYLRVLEAVFVCVCVALIETDALEVADPEIEADCDVLGLLLAVDESVLLGLFDRVAVLLGVLESL